VSPVTLGIDVGTTSVKAILLDGDGRVAAVAGNQHGIVRRAGVVEADPEQWWDSARAALHQLAEVAGGLIDEVAAVGVTGNMSSVVLLDRRLEPLGNAPLLADSRGERELAALPPEIRELIVARTRNQPATAFSLSTLLYLREAEPGLLEAASAWISAKDYLRLRLTGSVGTDLTDAYNSLLIRAGDHDWDPELIDAAGLPKRIFPGISPSAEPAGVVSRLAAAATGIPVGVPVVTGAGDIAAGALGAGITGPGDVLISLGTSVTALAPVDDSAGTGWLGRLTYHPSASGGPGLALASLLTGGLALNWLRELLGEAAIAAAAAEPLAADDPLVFLPHLAGTGSPGFLPYVHGSLLGLRPSTRDADVIRALFEAIGFEIAEALTLLGTGRDGDILVSGGGARLPAWAQTIADILGRSVGVGADPDVSAIGAARLAWAGLAGAGLTGPGRAGPGRAGGAPILAAAPDPVPVETRYEPVAERAGPLRRRAGAYQRARDFMATYYQQSRAGNSTP
jgi:xylulokinase